MSDLDLPNAEMLTQRPFAERQLLVITKNLVVKAAEKLEQISHVEKETGGKWHETAVSGALSLLGGVQSNVAKILNSAYLEAYKSVRRALDKGLPIQVISYDASRALDFPPGHPRLDTVYACHPVNPKTYYPLADFHRVAFEGKFAEAMTLLMALGADSIRVEHVTGWARDFASSVAGAVPGGSMAIETTKSSEKSESLLFEASLRGTHLPIIPDRLVWYQYEPTWQSISAGRLNYGLDAFRLSVIYNDDYGIDAKLASSIKGAGLGIGGKFQAHQATVWQIEGTFRRQS